MITPDNLAAVLGVLVGLAWPVVILVFLFLCRNEIRGLLKRVQKAKLPGGTEAQFESSKQAALAALTDGKQGSEPALQSEDILPKLIKNLKEEACWYLLKVANKAKTFDEHLDALAREFGKQYEAGAEDENPIGQAFSLGYHQGFWTSLRGVVFSAKKEPDEKYVVELTSEVVELINRKLGLQQSNQENT